MQGFYSASKNSLGVVVRFWVRAKRVGGGKWRFFVSAWYK